AQLARGLHGVGHIAQRGCFHVILRRSADAQGGALAQGLADAHAFAQARGECVQAHAATSSGRMARSRLLMNSRRASSSKATSLTSPAPMQITTSRGEVFILRSETMLLKSP